MLTSGITALVASFLYFYASAVIWQRIKYKSTNDIRNKVLFIAILATTIHALSLGSSLYSEAGILFHMGNGLSLVALLASVALLITCINKNTTTLGIFVYPLATISTLLPLIEQGTKVLPFVLGTHILISIAAYSIMGIATAQAILYGVQEYRFRTKKLSSLMQALPPLQVMENTLIQLLIIGFLFLSFALTSGVYFIEDVFAQHLIHKTFFAILAWSVYGILLFGHFKYGWRGQKAARFTIWAYFLLIISYLGTEVILSSLGY